MLTLFTLRGRAWVAGSVLAILGSASLSRAEKPVDFNRDIRAILANGCLRCHGPDEAERKADLRFDTREGALADLGGHAAIVPGKPGESEIFKRITSEDPDERMPPPSTGKQLTPHEVDLLKRWVAEGANFSVHWAYQVPKKVAAPEVGTAEGTGRIAHPTSEIDRFVRAKLSEHGLMPSEEADRATLIRRVSLDLTGLPPTDEEVSAYLADTTEGAYDRLVDRLLDKPAFGEHWARMWLDLARYADSSGYADDPMRTIWGYRDYVIRSFNANKPFDQFTIEQLAGDLLPNPTEEQLVATAFHRNTLTNNEGGTNDEEFRNVAVVDRVNTTFAVWMATTISCAQCHTHKYDPITQKEYFEVFAILNNTADADRGDDSPRLDLYSEEQKANKAKWLAELAALDAELSTLTPALQESLAKWDRDYPRDLPWTGLKPAAATSQNGAELTIGDDQSVLVKNPPKTDVTTLLLPAPVGPLSALRIEALTDPSLPGNGPGHAGGNFVISRVSATIIPKGETRPQARFVRIESPGKGRYLHLAEVQVFSGADNVALKGKATQSSVGFGGVPERGNDGNTNGNYYEGNSVFHTEDAKDDPWWEVDLQAITPVDKVVIWNRTDGAGERFANSKITLLDEQRKPVWEQVITEAPKANGEYAASAAKGLKFATALADFSQDTFSAEAVLVAKAEPSQGWAIGGKQGEPHWLVLFPEAATELAADSQIQLVIEQTSQFENHLLGKLRVSASASSRAIEVAKTPVRIRELLAIATEARTPAQATELATWYIANAAPELAAQRVQRAKTHSDLVNMKPDTSVPVCTELAGEARRKTKLQHRGNYLDQGDEVPEGVPAALLPVGGEIPKDRLALAKWIVSRDNPLTARVMVNRLWEALFGQGIVVTSEDFGTQGELPTHPELFDALAIDFMDSGWNVKGMLKQMVTSATYRQSSKVTPAGVELDPDNRWFSRGPRFRMSAEMIRDQSLALSGLLSSKMYGAPVRPPQPKLGLSAAFGSSTDWETSLGEDRYRRALYTQFRRSNPYPSMAAFDAPNREVCTVRRIRTNTPLQALVTLNDPVHLEAAQALARQIVRWDGSLEERAKRLFRHCTARDPHPDELTRLTQLHETVRTRAAADFESAKLLASDPLGPIPEGLDPVDLAAWTVVGNVILNLDEMLMKR